MIYFAFNSSSVDDLIRTGIGKFGAHDRAEYNGMIFGLLHTTKWQYRAQIEQLDTRLMCLPGPANGILTAQHAAHIAPAIPTAKQGDAMSSAVLQVIYEATGCEGFNPQHH